MAPGGSLGDRCSELARAGDHRAIAALVALLLGLRASEIISRLVADLLTVERGLAGHLIATTLGHEDERTTMHALSRPAQQPSA